MKLTHPEDFNIELGEKVLRYLRRHPWQHHQINWQHCIAGWVVRLHDEDMRHASRRSDELERRACLNASDYLGLHGSWIGSREQDWLFGFTLNSVARHRLASCIRQAKKARRAILGPRVDYELVSHD